MSARRKPERKKQDQLIKTSVAPILVEVGDIANSQDAWAKIFRGTPPYDLGLPMALLLKQKLAPIMQEYNDTRRELLEIYGKPRPDNPDRYSFADKDGKIDRKALDGFRGEMDELNSAIISIDFSISIEALEKSKVELTAVELAACAWLLEETRGEYPSADQEPDGEDEEGEDE